MNIDIDPSAVKSGFDAFRSAIDTIKAFRELFKSDPAKHKEVGHQIELAERQLQLAEAQIAQALGYPLCMAHFPPVPMLKDRVEPRFVETVYRCPECKREEPSSEYFENKSRLHNAFERYNEQVAREYDWMSR